MFRNDKYIKICTMLFHYKYKQKTIDLKSTTQRKEKLIHKVYLRNTATNKFKWKKNTFYFAKCKQHTNRNIIVIFYININKIANKLLSRWGYFAVKFTLYNLHPLDASCYASKENVQKISKVFNATFLQRTHSCLRNVKNYVLISNFEISFICNIF